MKLFPIIAFVASALTASADGNTSLFPPYSDDLNRLLSGVWSEDATMAPGGRFQYFSWGAAYYWPNDSRIIDLQDGRPYLLMIDGSYEIVSIEIIDKTLIRLNMRRFFSKEEVGFIVVRILGKDKIRFESHLKEEKGFWFKSQLYRHYGPEKLLQEGK